MENRFSQLKVLAVLACALAVPACALAFPLRAYALPSWLICYVQDSSGNKTYYDDLQAGIDNGCGEDKVVVVIGGDGYTEYDPAVHIPAGQKVTINFNGCAFRNEWGTLFELKENSSLTLQSYSPKAVTDSDGRKFPAGVIYDSNGQYGGAISMKEGSSLTLDNMTIKESRANAVKGNPGTHGCGGAIYAEKNCTIDLKNGSQITGNTSDNYGGGIYINGENVKVTLDNSKICNNKAEQGGGVYIDGTNAVIDLKNGSSIDGNTATEAGGGIYCNVSFFTITSSEGEGRISGNRSEGSSTATTKGKQSGGGIHVDSRSGENEGLIENLTIAENYSAYDGGGLELDQRWTTVRNCIIKDNWCKYEGGGIYDCNSNNLIDGCTITGNACSVDSGGNYEGGGVFVWHSYDLKVSGKCTVKGNTRGKDSGNADDVLLRDNAGSTARAYITGSLAEGSSVGVRTGVVKADRRIAKGFSYPESRDCLFMDLADNYFVTYGTDEGGDAWQRYGTREFSLKVDGAEQGRYAGGSTVTATAEPAAGKFFVRWDTGKTEGLNPIGDYIADSNLYSSSLSFKMPQNDVNLVAVYADETTAGTLTLAAPKAGEDLPAEATFSPKASGGSPVRAVTAKISWYKTVDGGKAVAASGRAEYGATYFAEVAVDADRENELIFADKVSMTASTGSIKSAEVRADGSLLITTGAFATAKPTVTEVAGASVTVQEGSTEEELRALLPTTALARTNAGTAVELKVDTVGGDLSELIDDVTRKVIMPADGKPVTVQIPLKASSEVTIPSDKRTVAVTVTVTERSVTAPEAPTVTPGKGTYPTSAQELDEQGRLKLEAACGTPDATIRYRLCKADGEWTDSGEQAYEGPIYLEKKDNDQCLYDLEIWSVKDGVESEHVTLLYIIDDTQYVDVTVDYTDTAIEGHHGSKKSETHSVRKGKSLTVVAPDREGYVFEKWVGADNKELSTSASYTFDSVDEATTVTAVYNPVVSAVDIDIDAPEAHKALSQAAGEIRVRAGGSDEWTDITALLTNGRNNPKVSWAPGGKEAEDEDTGELVDTGEAEHMVSYTATVALEKGDNASEAKYVLPDGAAVWCKGTEIDGASAHIASAADGSRTACIAFPSTGPIENAELENLETVELSHEEAWDYQAEQDAGRDASWDLPDEVTAKSDKCGCEVALGIDWEKVTGFKKDDYGEQSLTVKGKVVYPSYVDHDGGAETVTATIRVAAAERVGSLQASIPSGTYKGTQDVAFVCETDDVTVRYTTDGSEPTEESPVYDGGWIEVAESASFKVKAFRDGWKPSETLELAYEIVHDVTFDAAGGSAVRAQEVEHGKPATRPADPVLAGCAFEGWYAEGAEDAYDFSEPVTADLELHARWSAKGEPVELHAVTFDPAGGTEVPEQHVAHGGCATRPADPELDGFEFEGWLTEDGEEYDFSAKVTSDVALHASWSRGGETVSAHTVTFDSAGGSAVGAQTVADGAKAKDPGAPALAGFVFAGWATGDGESYDFDSKVTGDLVLYARWAADGEEALAHLVVFDSAGGTAVPAQTVADGETVERPADPTRKGHEFQGWYAEDSKDAYDFGTRVTDDLILYAYWAKGDDGAVEHLVTFDSAGGTPVASQTVADGQRAEEPAAPTRSGYEFLGWTLDGSAYDFSTPVTADLELKASWKKRESKKDDTEKNDDSRGDSDSTDDQKANTIKTTAVTTVTTSADNNLAATGDRTLLIVGALVALGLLAAAVGVLAKCRNK